MLLYPLQKADLCFQLQGHLYRAILTFKTVVVFQVASAEQEPMRHLPVFHLEKNVISDALGNQ